VISQLQTNSVEMTRMIPKPEAKTPGNWWTLFEHLQLTAFAGVRLCYSSGMATATHTSTTLTPADVTNGTFQCMRCDDAYEILILVYCIWYQQYVIDTWRSTGVRIFVLNESTRGCSVILINNMIRVIIAQGASPTDVRIGFELLYSARHLWAKNERIIMGAITSVWRVPITYYTDLSYALLDSFIHTIADDIKTRKDGTTVGGMSINRARGNGVLRWWVPNRMVKWSLSHHHSNAKDSGHYTDLDATDVMIQLLHRSWPDKPLPDLPKWPTRAQVLHIEFRRFVEVTGLRDTRCITYDHCQALTRMAMTPLSMAERDRVQHQLLPHLNNEHTPILSPCFCFVLSTTDTLQRVIPIAMYDGEEHSTLLARTTLDRYKFAIDDPFDPLFTVFAHMLHSHADGVGHSSAADHHDDAYVCQLSACHPPVDIVCAPGRVTGSGLTAMHLLLVMANSKLGETYLLEWLGITLEPFDVSRDDHRRRILDGTLQWLSNGTTDDLKPQWMCDRCTDMNQAKSTAAGMPMLWSGTLGPRFRSTTKTHTGDIIDLCQSCHTHSRGFRTSSGSISSVPVPVLPTTPSHGQMHAVGSGMEMEMEMIPPAASSLSIIVVPDLKQHHKGYTLVRHTLSAPDHHGYTPVHTAAFGYPEALHLLLRVSMTFPDLIDWNTPTSGSGGLSPVACAARGLQPRCIAMLVGDHRTRYQLVHGDSIDGALPIHHLLRSLVIHRGALDVHHTLGRKLIDQHARVNTNTKLGKRDIASRLMVATLKIMLSAAPHTVNAVTRSGDCVLELAARTGDAEILKVLMAFGVQPLMEHPTPAPSPAQVQVTTRTVTSSASSSSSSSSSSSQAMVAWEAALANGDIQVFLSFLQLVYKYQLCISVPPSLQQVHIVHLIIEYIGSILTTAERVILYARDAGHDMLESLGLPHRLPPLHCIREDELTNRELIGDAERIGEFSIVWRATWRNKPVIIKSVLFSENEHDRYRADIEALDNKFTGISFVYAYTYVLCACNLSLCRDNGNAFV
jgi:hypothetical protein